MFDSKRMLSRINARASFNFEMCLNKTSKSNNSVSFSSSYHDEIGIPFDT